MLDTAKLTAAVAALTEYTEQVRLVLDARGYPDAEVFVRVGNGNRDDIGVDTATGHDSRIKFIDLPFFAEALAYAESLPTQPKPDDFAAAIGIAPDGRVLEEAE